jgi:hypothetical protein
MDYKIEEITLFNNRKRFIKKEDEKTFLIEGEARFLKLPMSEPSKIEFEYGPKLIVGKDFYGKGIIECLEQADASSSSYKAVRVKLK